MPLYIDLICYADIRGLEIKFFFLLEGEEGLQSI